MKYIYHSIIMIILLSVCLLCCNLDEPGPPDPDTEDTMEAPLVTGISPTNNTRPTWNWTTPDGAVDFRYNLDNAGWITTGDITVTSYTPPKPLKEGPHTLQVQAQGKSGNWSKSGRGRIVIDLTPPDPPQVVGPSITNNPTPTWSWGIPPDAVNIRYQLDGTGWIGLDGVEPAAFTPDSPLSEGSHTLEVMARDLAGNWSAPGSFTIVIDFSIPSPPEVSGPSLTNNTQPEWTWTVPSDTVNFRCRLDQGEWIETGDTSVTSFIPGDPLSEGSHTLEVQARNTAGTWSESGIKIITIDITPPDPPVVSGVSPTNDPTPPWIWTIPEGTADIQYRLDNRQWNITGGVQTTSYTPETPLDEGNHTLEVQAQDFAGNWSESGIRVIYIDLTPPDPPEVTGTTPTNDTTPAWDWTIPESAVDFRHRLDGGDWTVTGGTTITSWTPEESLDAGNHTLEVEARDNVGNWSEPGSHTIFIDTSAPNPPVVTGTSPTNNQNPTWSWTIPAGVINFRYRLNGSEWTLTNGTGITTYTPSAPLSEGSYILEVQAQNSIGNWSDSGVFTIVIDLTPPAPPDVDSPTPTNDTTPTWTWNTPSGTVNFRYCLDSGNWVETGSIAITSYTPSTPLSEGSHTLEVQARDQAGNWSVSGSRLVIIDLSAVTPPFVSGTSPTNDTTPTWTWTIPAEAVDIRYRLNGGAWTYVGGIGQTSYTPSTPLGEGSHTLEVQAGNSAGTWSQSGTKIIIIDLTPPEPPQVTGESPTTDPTPMWTWNIPEETVNFRYSLNSEPWTETGENTTTFFTPQTPLPAGNHTLEVQAQDEAGNWSSSGIQTIVIDFDLLPPPVVSGTSPTTDTTPTWTWTIPSGSVDISYRLDSGEWMYVGGTHITSYTPPAPLSFGDHTLYVRAQNGSGNWSDNGSRTITIQLAIPTGVTATKGTISNRIDISFDSVSGADSYIIHRAESETGPYSPVYETSSTMYADVGILYQVYYYKVQAKTSEEYTSELSDSDYGYPALPTPVNVQASDGLFNDRIQITWTQYEQDFEYAVFRSTEESGMYEEIAVTINNLFDDTSILDGNIYFYKVCIKLSSFAYGPLSAADSGFRIALDAPSFVEATDGLYDDRIIIEWDTVLDTEEYHIYRSPDETGEYTLIHINPNNIINPANYEDFDVEPGVIYYYKIQAWSEAAGFGPFSDYDSGYRAVEIPPPPPNVNASKGVFPDRILITWGEVSDVQEYQVYKSTDINGTYELIQTTANLQYEDFDVVPGQVYYYKLKSVGTSGGISEYSPAESGFAD